MKKRRFVIYIVCFFIMGSGVGWEISQRFFGNSSISYKEFKQLPYDYKCICAVWYQGTETGSTEIVWEARGYEERRGIDEMVSHLDKVESIAIPLDQTLVLILSNGLDEKIFRVKFALRDVKFKCKYGESDVLGLVLSIVPPIEDGISPYVW